MANRKLLKEFPFLEEMENRFGELGNIRIRKVSLSDALRVKDLPKKSRSSINFDVIELKPLPKNLDEGFLFCKQTVKGDGLLPDLTQSVIFKYKIEEESSMIFNDTLNEQEGDLFSVGKLVERANSFDSIIKVANPDADQVDFVNNVVKFHPELTVPLNKAIEVGIVLENDDWLTGLLVITQIGNIFQLWDVKMSEDGNILAGKFNVGETPSKIEVPTESIKRIVFVRNGTAGWTQDFEEEYMENLNKLLGISKVDVRFKQSFLAMLCMTADTNNFNKVIGEDVGLEGYSYVVKTGLGENKEIGFEIIFNAGKDKCIAQWPVSSENPILLKGSIKMFVDEADSLTQAW